MQGLRASASTTASRLSSTEVALGSTHCGLYQQQQQQQQQQPQQQPSLSAATDDLSAKAWAE
jgi:hypothetical protein